MYWNTHDIVLLGCTCMFIFIRNLREKELLTNYYNILCFENLSYQYVYKQTISKR